jgi:hypothetical protein
MHTSVLPRLPCPGGKALPKRFHELIGRQLNGLVCRQLLGLRSKYLHHLHRYNPRRLWKEGEGEREGGGGGREGEGEGEGGVGGGRENLTIKIK